MDATDARDDRTFPGEENMHLAKCQKSEEKDNVETGENPTDCLSGLYNMLKEPIPEKPTAKYIADTAQNLIDTLNEKRKNDALLMDQFRQALETQTQTILEKLQQQLYQAYDAQSAHVDQKLQELFASLDTISASETELQNFGESLKLLFQEIHTNPASTS